MLDSRRFYDEEIEKEGTFTDLPRNQKPNSYKNWKEMQFGRPDFVSSLGQLLQDKNSEFGSLHLQSPQDDSGEGASFTYEMDANCGQSDLFRLAHQFESESPTDTCHCKKIPQRDPAIADLYRILWLQNEQLSLLHKQVADLVSLKEKEKTKVMVADMSTSTDDFPLQQSLKTAEASVNTMTICCQGCKPNMKKTKQQVKHTKKPLDDPLLSLKDLDVPRLDYSSSNASVHIDLDKCNITSSSETDESDSSSVEESHNPVGWTFYNNVMGQVNNLLDLAKQPINFTSSQEVNASYQMPPSYLSKRVTFGNSQRVQERIRHGESDISMKINSLASKYIDCGVNSQVKDISMCNVVAGNTNMSMATIRYMEKHRLLQSPDMNPDFGRRKNKYLHKRSQSAPSNKVLDATAIRQQSKLLPKFD